MVRLGALLRPGLRLGGPLVACLTVLQAQRTFQYPDHLFDFLALPVECAALFGAEAEPVRGVGLAAVSHDKHLHAPGQSACGLPVGLLEILAAWPARNTPIFLALTDEVPPVVTDPLEELLRGMPRVTQDELRLTPQALPRIAEPLQGKGEL